MQVVHYWIFCRLFKLTIISAPNKVNTHTKRQKLWVLRRESVAVWWNVLIHVYRHVRSECWVRVLDTGRWEVRHWCWCRQQSTSHPVLASRCVPCSSAYRQPVHTAHVYYKHIVQVHRGVVDAATWTLLLTKRHIISRTQLSSVNHRWPSVPGRCSTCLDRSTTVCHHSEAVWRLEHSESDRNIPIRFALCGIRLALAPTSTSCTWHRTHWPGCFQPSVSATELYRQLHWLPIRQRVTYKI